MSAIFDFLKILIQYIVSFFTGLLNLGSTTNDAIGILSDWFLFIPVTVQYYIAWGLVISVILLIVGRLNGK
jgi:hypothetical protein